MKNRIEFTLKNLNKEKIIKDLSQKYKLENLLITQSEFSFKVPVKDSKEVTKVLNKYNSQLIKQKQSGIFYFLNKGIFRIGVLVPIIIFCILSLISNFFIFNYQILGNELVSDDEIYKILNDQNMKGIISKSKIDTKKIESEISKKNKISFVSVIVRGNTLIVGIKEKVFNSEYEDKGTFQPILSSFCGKITEISVIQGTQCVKIGQVVNVGDTLVMPYVIDTGGNKLSIKPMADIKADVYYNTITQIPDVETIFEDTGNIEKTRKVEINGLNIFSNEGICKFKIYRSEQTIEYLTNKNILPVKVVKTTFYEQQKVIINNNFEKDKVVIIDNCREKTRLLIKDYEIIKEEYYATTYFAGINQISYTIVVNKSIC